MIPWYWLVVAAAVPTLWAIVLLEALKRKRIEAKENDERLRTTVESWSRLYGDAAMKLQRIRNVLDETHPPIKSNDHSEP